MKVFVAQIVKKCQTALTASSLPWSDATVSHVLRHVPHQVADSRRDTHKLEGKHGLNRMQHIVEEKYNKTESYNS